MDSGAAFGDRNGYTLTFDGLEALPFAFLEDYTTIISLIIMETFFYEWLEKNYITLIKKTLKRELGKDAKLEYNILLDTPRPSPHLLDLEPL